MTLSNTVIREAETLHRKLALIANAVIGELEANGIQRDSVYTVAIYEQLQENTKAAGQLIEKLENWVTSEASFSSARTANHHSEANEHYQPDYQGAFALLNWLNVNRSALKDKNLEWFVSMCKTNPVLKPVYEQLFNGDPSDIAPSNPKRPGYNRALDLLEWLNINRSEITEQDREWIRQMNETSNAFKQICLQLFGTEFLASHNTPAAAGAE